MTNKMLIKLHDEPNADYDMHDAQWSKDADDHDASTLTPAIRLMYREFDRKSGLRVLFFSFLIFFNFVGLSCMSKCP